MVRQRLFLSFVICAAIWVSSTGAATSHDPNKIKVNSDTSVNDIECEFCMLVFTEVENELGDNRTEENIQAVLEKVCDILPGGLKNECENMLKQYLPTLIKLLEAAMTPAEICHAMNMCDKSAAKQFFPPSHRKYSARPALKAKNHEDRACSLCTQVFDYVGNQIIQNETETLIIQALDMVCMALDAHVEKCAHLMVDNVQFLVAVIKEGQLTSKAICQAMSICNQDPNALPLTSMHHRHLHHLKAKKPVKGVECEICERVFAYIYSFVSSNSTEQEIENVLDGICKYLPSKDRSVCTALVAKEVPLLVQLIKNDVPPKQICSLIQMCTESRHPNPFGYHRQLLSEKSPHKRRAMKLK